MTSEEQIKICKVIAKACMWGHGSIAIVILGGLQEKMPTDPNWEAVYSDNVKTAAREAVGIVKDEAELLGWLSRGYWLTNYEPGELSLFNPRPMNGLAKYVVGDLADKYGRTHDQWNFDIYENQKSEVGK